MLIQSIKMAWESITSNKMRSFLTMLGIIIGVFALVVLVSIVSGATGSITDAVAGLGSDSLNVTVIDDKGEALTLAELRSWAGQGSIDRISPTSTVNAAIKSGYNSEMASIYGVVPEYLDIEGRALSAGRFLKEPDITNSTNVIVVTEAVLTDIMSTSASSALGSTVRVNGVPYEVIGVLAEDAGSTASLFRMTNYTAYIPYTSALRLSGLGTHSITSFTLSAVGGDLDTAQEEIGEILTERFEGDSEAFYVMNFNSVMNVMSDINGTLSLLMGGVAGISLLVGGIGIMNIMLVSVTERTREIGIRKAIGADRKTILLQFLMEGLMVSILGCIIGLILSEIALRFVSSLSENITFHLDPKVGLLAAGFSLGIGLLFGLYPANKAARKKPIDALRYNG